MVDHWVAELPLEGCEDGRAEQTFVAAAVEAQDLESRCCQNRPVLGQTNKALEAYGEGETSSDPQHLHASDIERHEQIPSST